ncbi:MAG: transporter [Caulobacteraceae bacterium]|nr:transporter [Caulobacteraceae bacterium]
MTRFALVLGALSAAGPLAIDMYLPALPAIARDLHAGQGHAEMSLMSFFIGLTIGQPIYGPLSDRLGRRRPILAGLALYIAASIACSLARSVDVLIVGRGLQGLGAGAGMAIGAAIVRDIYAGAQAARLLALRVLVLGVSPILAPILGAAVISVASWRDIFWFAAGFGVLCAVLTFMIPETRPEHARADSRLSGALGVYRRLLADRTFMGAVLTAACMQAAFIAYIAGSSFVFMTMLGAPPWVYSLIFAVNAVGFIGCAQFTPQLMRRFRPEQLILFAATVQSCAAVLMLLMALAHHVSLPLLLPPLFVFLACYGLVGGPSAVLALRDHGAVAGTAAALMSFMQMASAALGAALIAFLANGTALPMTGLMVAGAGCGLLAARHAFTRRVAPAA